MFTHCFTEFRLAYRIYKRLIRDKSSFLHESGWIESLRQGKPCNKNGSPLPWMNYAVIQFLEGRLHKKLDVFEYGSGFSSLFYAARVHSLISVEHNRSWLDRIQAQLPPNATTLFQAEDVDGAYCRSIHETGQTFDIVVIDGRDRISCLQQAVSALNPAGIILLDDSARSDYLAQLQALAAQGFRQLTFSGPKPSSNHVRSTTLLYKDKNCLGI